MDREAGSLSPEQFGKLLGILRDRFARNRARHEGIAWKDVETRITADKRKAWSLFQMESTGGEPDVIDRDRDSGECVFADCSAESPIGRRSLCYDQAALEQRKENRPRGSAEGMATEMGIDVLTEAQYRRLQELGDFDRKTSSWVRTPDAIRKLGGALFCDRRYGTVFVYHNGAESYYGARAFRGILRI